jgi:IS4 transposase
MPNRSSGRRYKLAAEQREGAELSHRLRNTPLSVRRLASIYPMRSCTCRIHPADHALAGRAAVADLALSDGWYASVVTALTVGMRG